MSVSPQLVKALILPAVQALPRRDGLSDDDIDRAAFDASAFLVFHVGGDIARSRKVGTQKAARLLGELSNHLTSLAREIDRLPAEAQAALADAVIAIDARRVANEAAGRDSLRDHAPHPLAFAVTAEVMASAAGAAQKTIEAGPQAQGRKQPKRAAAAVAKRAASLFEAVTGKSATVATNDGKAYGPFLAFVGAVFDALYIDASPETFARGAVREKSREKSGG